MYKRLVDTPELNVQILNDHSTPLKLETTRTCSVNLTNTSQFAGSQKQVRKDQQRSASNVFETNKLHSRSLTNLKMDPKGISYSFGNLFQELNFGRVIW